MIMTLVYFTFQNQFTYKQNKYIFLISLNPQMRTAYNLLALCSMASEVNMFFVDPNISDKLQ